MSDDTEEVFPEPDIQDAWAEWQNSAHERRRIAALDVRWKANALCITEKVPVSVFFPERKRGDVAAAEARKYCLRCPVRMSCAKWAEDAGVEHGVFGGASPKQRQRMKALGTLDVLKVMKPPKVDPAA